MPIPTRGFFLTTWISLLLPQACWQTYLKYVHIPVISWLLSPSLQMNSTLATRWKCTATSICVYGYNMDANQYRHTLSRKQTQAWNIYILARSMIDTQWIWFFSMLVCGKEHIRLKTGHSVFKMHLGRQLYFYVVLDDLINPDQLLSRWLLMTVRHMLNGYITADNLSVFIIFTIDKHHLPHPSCPSLHITERWHGQRLSACARRSTGQPLAISSNIYNNCCSKYISAFFITNAQRLIILNPSPFHVRLLVGGLSPSTRSRQSCLSSQRWRAN